MMVIREAWKLAFSVLKIKDIGAYKFILGIEQSSDQVHIKLWLIQCKYVNTILWWFVMHDCKLVSVSLHVGINISLNICPKLNEYFEDIYNFLILCYL